MPVLGGIRTTCENLSAGAFLVGFEVIEKEIGEFPRTGIKGGLIAPTVAGDEDVGGDIGDFGDGLETEERVGFGGSFGEFSAVDRFDDGSGVFEFDAFADAVAAFDPAGVDEPDVDLVVLHFFGEEFGVAGGVEAGKVVSG